MSELLPQPPPDAPAPPISEFERRSIRWRNWLLGIGIVSMLGVLGVGLLLSLSRGLFHHRPHDRIESINNLRQVGLALFEFETTYGRFPNASTNAQLNKDYPSTTIPLGTTSSNDFFRQLFVAEIVASESMFYSRMPGSGTPRKPDNVFHGYMALEKGECGFAYIAGMSTTSNPPDTPLALAPLVPGKLRFDYKHCKEFFDGKAVILRIDNSVQSLPVDKSGRVFINGKDLFDPSQPFWGGKAPDVKWPE